MPASLLPISIRAAPSTIPELLPAWWTWVIFSTVVYLRSAVAALLLVAVGAFGTAQAHDDPLAVEGDSGWTAAEKKSGHDEVLTMVRIRQLAAINAGLTELARRDATGWSRGHPRLSLRRGSQDQAGATRVARGNPVAAASASHRRTAPGGAVERAHFTSRDPVGRGEGSQSACSKRALADGPLAVSDC